MSETIEERAKRICKRLDYIDAWNAGGEEAIELIDDLMAERGKMRELATKIDAYDFECEGGPMKNCVEWIALKESLNVQNK